LESKTELLFPYTLQIASVAEQQIFKWLWNHRTTAWSRPDFSGKTYRECGRSYWEYHQIPIDRNRTPLSIVFAFVATLNHFVLDRGGKVFKQTAPVIKLPAGATEDDHFALLGLLNSSTACFWGRQTCFPKGGFADGKWEERLEWDGTKVQTFPLPADRPLTLTRQLDTLAQRLSSLSPAAWVGTTVPTAALLAERAQQFAATLAQMIALQEELDWHCYKLYGLTSDDLQISNPSILALGQRAFEIVLARRIAAGEEESSWFTRHGSTPITEIPKEWPAEYRKVVQKRIDLIESDKNIALIERPEYKRRASGSVVAKNSGSDTIGKVFSFSVASDA
jgi:hypothetical protein